MHELRPHPPALWRLGWVAALTVVALPAAIAAADAGGPVGATVTALQGQAEVVGAGSLTALPAHVGMRVAPGSTVRTKADGRIELQFDDRSLLRLDHSTQIQILSQPAQRGVLVTLGRIWTHVQTVLGVSKFQVQTPTVVAGARGTIIRAEVTPEEAEIAVDEGEVELTGPERRTPVLLRQSMACRAKRGLRGLTPVAFDPQAREKWEFWTDPLVQERIAATADSAAAVRASAADVKQQVRTVYETLAVDGAAAKRIGDSLATADRLVRSVAVALGVGPPAKRGQEPTGPPTTKAQLLARLDTAGRIYADAGPLITRGRQSVQEHTRQVKDLRDKLAAYRQAEQDLRTKLRAFCQEREVDPHWALFRPRFEQCEGHRAEIARACEESAPLLSPDYPAQLGDNPQMMPNIQARVRWSLQMLDAFERQIPDRQDKITSLKGMLNH